jgi:phage baseplate assembly protein gpV
MLLPLSAQTIAAPIAANQYHCTGKNSRVDYSSSSFSGEPLLSIQLGKTRFSAQGEAIQAQQTVLGHVLTLVKSATPDLKTLTVSVLLPDVNVTQLGDKVAFESQLFQTKTMTSIGGSALVNGVIQRNTAQALHCTATAVVF